MRKGEVVVFCKVYLQLIASALLIYFQAHPGVHFLQECESHAVFKFGNNGSGILWFLKGTAVSKHK